MLNQSVATFAGLDNTSLIMFLVFSALPSYLLAGVFSFPTVKETSSVFSFTFSSSNVSLTSLLFVKVSSAFSLFSAEILVFSLV